VSDGVNVTDPVSFLIEATPLLLHLDVLSALDAFPGVLQPITARHLHASTNDPNQTRPIVFTIRSGPRLGRLVVGENSFREKSTSFSQEDINVGRVGYQHTATSADTAWTQTDSFLFDVSTEYAETPLRSRLFSISVSYEHVNHDNINWLVTLGTVTVEEGSEVVISKSTLDVTPLQRRLNDIDVDTVVRYIIINSPQHGSLQISGLNLSTADQFDQHAVDAGQLVYHHHGSDTTSDHFIFSLDFATAETNLDEAPQTFTFNISILAVDDQPFHLVTTSPHVELVQGSAHTITRDDLLTLDDDSPPGQIIYNIYIPATNGRLHNATTNVTQFTQLDIDQLKISFVSDGSLHNSSFQFYVSDGAHTPLHKVPVYFAENNHCFYFISVFFLITEAMLSAFSRLQHFTEVLQVLRFSVPELPQEDSYSDLVMISSVFVINLFKR